MNDIPPVGSATSIETTSDIRRVLPQEWDQLANGDVMSGHGWLKTVQETHTQKMEPRYVLLRERGRLIGASVCYFTDDKAGPVNLDKIFWGRLQDPARGLGLSFLPTAECYPFRQYGRHFFIEKSLPSAERAMVLRRLFLRVEEDAFQDGRSMCFIHVMEHEQDLIQLLRTAGYFETMGYPVNYVDIEWPDFEGYKKAADRLSRGMRRNITREINRNRREGVRIRPLENLEGSEDRLHELLDMNHRKHNGIPFPFRRDFLKKLKDNLGEDCVIYAAEKKGIISGVSLLLRRGPVGHSLMVGVDHDYAGNDATYFNISVYRPIQDAIQSRMRRLYMGNAQYVLKQRRGSLTSYCYLFYKSPKWAQNAAARAWFPLHRRWYQKKHARFRISQYIPVSEAP